MAEKPSVKEKNTTAPAEDQPKAKPDSQPAAKSDTKTTPVPAAKAGAKPADADKAKDVDAGGDHEEMVEVGAFGIWMQEFLHQMPSWMVSMVVHMVILLVLAMMTVSGEGGVDLRQLIIAPDENMDDLQELEDDALEEIDVEMVSPEVVSIESEVEAEDPEVSPVDDMEAAAMQVELSDVGLEHAPRNDLLTSVGAYTGDGLSGRGAARQGLVAQGGGNAASERAVAMALKWFANHQFPDGGWNFNHAAAGACRNQCRNPGTLKAARNAATAMALLPFLGAGQTHRKGTYKNTVKAGLYYLVTHMKVSPKGGDLSEAEGRMYSHGLASIVLCEAFAMTQDKGLHNPAQEAVKFICYAQDPVGGGWRYEPRTPGDTSVVGWQIMALKSGHMAYLQVPPVVVKKAFIYLNTVQANSGSHYGYNVPGTGSATTAIGLLCRMYLGWKKDNPALERGAQWISNLGPDASNMYYNYYATQVMRHWDGDLWKKWNGKMREQLITTQVKDNKSHEFGSWYSKGGHGDSAGRLYCTAMATMILEVYYRHLPIYRTQSVEEDFPE